MDFKANEVIVKCQIEAGSEAVEEIATLSDLQLMCVGGGSADVVFG